MKLNPIPYVENRFEERLPDRYWVLMIRLHMWREKTFPWWYARKQQRLHHNNMIEKFGFIPQVGHEVEDCRGQVHLIADIDPDDPDMVVFEDGFICSLWHCCDLPPGGRS